ncbi:hypothetical protein [Mangrovicella endophytica]|uniref:hypothetical protein n=1 Tax=Mangrovicella endophytica TaxID=2066697 RepID=UPI000C9DBF96|nr:hypothetical protein [Mangrovicella endophytica]
MLSNHPQRVRRVPRHLNSDGSRRPLRRPLPAWAKAASFGAGAAQGLAHLLVRRLGAVSVDFRPDAFEWTDGLDGCELMHIPLCLVHWPCGSRTYVDAMPKDVLLRDPYLCGTRPRIEAECLARRASYEVWTDTDLRPALRRRAVLEAADAEQRAGHALAPAGSAGTWPRVLRNLATRMGCVDLREVDGDWIARESLTGILRVVLRGVRVDPETRLVVWPSSWSPCLPPARFRRTRTTMPVPRVGPMPSAAGAVRVVRGLAA